MKRSGKQLGMIAAALFCLAFLSLAYLGRDGGAAGPKTKRDLLIGVKIYEYSGSLPRLFEEWRSLGINTAFVSASLGANREYRRLAKEYSVATFIIFPVFFNAEELEKHPDLFALTADGEKASDDWVKFVCPTREDYRKERIEYARRLVRDCDPDGLSLDFIRFFVFWEKVYPERTLSSLPQTCFDRSCLDKFQSEMSIKIPEGLPGPREKARWILDNHLQDWTAWKCRVIAGMVKDLAAEARKIKPGLKINVHAVPWRKDDFGGAIKTIAGQDLGQIAAYTDFVSPMCYHHMVLRDPAWVHSVVADVAAYAGRAVLPSIQVNEAYINKTLPVPEFEAALAEALKPPSKGVVFWSWDALEKSPLKKEVVRALCAGQP